MFLFPDDGINWYLSDEKDVGSGSNYSDIPPQIGLNKGDGVNFELVNVSLTDDVIDIEKYTNVGSPPGLYMWRVNNYITNGTLCSNSEYIK